MTDYEQATTRQTTTSLSDSGRNAQPVVADTVTTTERATVSAGPGGASIAARIVTFAFGLLQALLILRIILLMLVANPDNQIVGLVLQVTQPFVEPFQGMFSLDRVTADQGSVFDIAAMVALIGWTLIELVILAGIRIFERRSVTA